MAEATLDDGKIECQIDGARVHSIKIHIRDNYADAWSIERYQREFPGAPLLSKLAEDAVRRRKEEIKKEAAGEETDRKPMHEVFGLPSKSTINPRGHQIMVRTISAADLEEEDLSYVPDVDPNYVFNIELTKSALIAFELAMPAYFWGFHGTGKTTCWEQVCARTGRPFSRVQHTINTEEAHILGQYVVRDGETKFNLGPLPIAMLRGYVYCADEYDIAMPSVVAVYQPVLEGKALVIKDAPPELRVIRPHKNFRFVATGNTNGCGDETGLYQGTQIQNAANYSRFALTEEVGYMDGKVETSVVAGQAGIGMKEAGKLVEFANEVRKAFKGGQINMTVSPRELINAAKNGLVRGGDWRAGLKLAYMNRLSRTDREVVDAFAQRMFGEAA
jgi:cobaltochelatase CobS